MKSVKLFLKVSFAMAIFWYLVVAFIRWDICWPEIIPDAEPSDRVGMFLGFVMKLLLDAILFLVIEDAIKREAKK